MADIDPRWLEEQNRTLREILHVLSGGKTWGGGTPPATRGGGTALHAKSMGMFGAAIDKTTTSVKVMHGGIDDFVSSLRVYAGKIIGGEIIYEITKGAMTLAKTYTRMADIGQTFGGSMFEMAAQAGASGLSLEEFTKMIERNSTAAALMQQRSDGTANSMGGLQKAVRNNLKDLGFLGMSLTQVTDMSSDYAETLRLTGRLGRMNEEQQASAISDMAKDVTAFGDATGKSRQEMLKLINNAFRETSAAMRMAAHPLNEAQGKAFSTITAFLSAMPGDAGEKMSKFFSQTFGAAGANPYFTELGKVFNQAGLSGLNARMSRMVSSVEKGVTPTIEGMVDDMLGMREEIMKNADSLRIRASTGDQAAAEALKVGQSLLGLSREELIQKMKHNKELEEQNKYLKAHTKNLMLLESNLHLITGAFQKGFYTAIDKALGTLNLDPTGDTMKNTMALLEDLGKAMGELVGNIFSQRNVNLLQESLRTITTNMRDPAFIDAMVKFKEGFISVVHTIESVVAKIHSFLQGTFGLSSGATTALMIGALLFRKTIFAMVGGVGRLLGGLGRLFGMNIHANQVVIRTGSVIGGGLGGGGGGLGGGGGGGGGRTPGTPRRGVRGVFDRLRDRIGGVHGTAHAVPRTGVGGFFDRMRARIGGVHPPAPSFIPPGTPAPAASGGLMGFLKGHFKMPSLRGGILGTAAAFVVPMVLDGLVSAFGDKLFNPSTLSGIKGLMESNTVLYAGIGAMFGPWGALAGGILGGILDTWKHPTAVEDFAMKKLDEWGFGSKFTKSIVKAFIHMINPFSIISEIKSIWESWKRSKGFIDWIKGGGKAPDAPSDEAPKNETTAPVQQQGSTLPTAPITPPPDLANLDINALKTRLEAALAKRDDIQQEIGKTQYIGQDTTSLAAQLKKLNDQIGILNTLTTQQNVTQKKQLDATQDLYNPFLQPHW
jgi:hypothetical protein